MDLLSWHTMLLSKLQSVNLQNPVSTIMVFHKTLFLIKELCSKKKKKKKVWQGTYPYEVHWYYHILPHSDRLVWWNGALNFWRFNYSASWRQYHAGLAEALWNAAHSLNQCSSWGVFSMIDMIYEPRNQRTKMGLAPLTLTTVTQ